MRQFVLGFLAALGLVLFVGASLSPVRNPTDPAIKQLFDSVQPKNFRVFYATPVVSALAEQEIVETKAPTHSLWFRHDNVLFFVKLTSHQANSN